MKASIIQRFNRHSEAVNRFLAEMESYTDDVLNRKPETGGWSALQTLHHILLAEALTFKYVQKKTGFETRFENAGLESALRSVALWLFLNLPFKFKAPKGVSEENLPDTSSLAEVRAEWNRIHLQWRAFFEQMPEELARKAVYKHPRAGRLSWKGTIGFFEEHFKRHTHQARRAVKA